MTDPALPTCPPAAGLRRDLGLADAVAIGLGAIVGAGIFVVTGVAAGVAGPAFLPAMAVAALAAGCNALSSAELAARYPLSGGAYEYGYRLLGPWPGYAAGWLFLTSKVAAAGTVALGLAGYLREWLPALPERPTAVAAVAALTAANVLGVRRSSRLNLAIVFVSLLSLLLFVAAGAGSFRAENLRPFAPNGWRGAAQAAALLFFAYTGYARVATLGEEVRDPRRTIPRAIVLTVAIAAALYLAVALVAVGAAGAPALSATSAPLRAAARALGVPGVEGAVAAGAVAAMLGVLLSQLLGLSRMGFAMARRGDLPGWLEPVDERHGVPRRAVLAVGAAAAMVAAVGSLRGSAAAASFAILGYYAIANAAALRLPREHRLVHPAVPAAGLAVCILLALALPPGSMLAGVGILAAGALLRIARRRSSPGTGSRR